MGKDAIDCGVDFEGELNAQSLSASLVVVDGFEELLLGR